MKERAKEAEKEGGERERSDKDLESDENIIIFYFKVKTLVWPF